MFTFTRFVCKILIYKWWVCNIIINNLSYWFASLLLLWKDIHEILDLFILFSNCITKHFNCHRKLKTVFFKRFNANSDKRYYNKQTISVNIINYVFVFSFNLTWLIFHLIDSIFPFLMNCSRKITFAVIVLRRKRGRRIVVDN